LSAVPLRRITILRLPLQPYNPQSLDPRIRAVKAVLHHGRYTGIMSKLSVASVSIRCAAWSRRLLSRHSADPTISNSTVTLLTRVSRA